MNVDFRECRAYGTPSFSAIPFDIEFVYMFTDLNLIVFKKIFLLLLIFFGARLRAVLIVLFILKRTDKFKVPVAVLIFILKRTDKI